MKLYTKPFETDVSPPSEYLTKYCGIKMEKQFTVIMEIIINLQNIIYWNPTWNFSDTVDEKEYVSWNKCKYTGRRIFLLILSCLCPCFSGCMAGVKNGGSEWETKKPSSNSSQVSLHSVTQKYTWKGMNPSTPNSGLNSMISIWKKLLSKKNNYSYTPKYISFLYNPQKVDKS